MTRKIIFFGSWICLMALIVLGRLVYQASPGPDTQEVRGLRLGKFDTAIGHVAISSRRLDCVPQAEAPYTATCTMQIEGGTLTVQALRNDPDSLYPFDGECTATYKNQVYDCVMTSPVIGIERYATIQEPLGLNAEQMADLRQKYYFENLPEAPYIIALQAIPMLVSIMVLLMLFAWRSDTPKWAWVIPVPMIIVGTLLSWNVALIIVFLVSMMVGVAFLTWYKRKEQKSWALTVVPMFVSLFSYGSTMVLLFILTMGLWD